MKNILLILTSLNFIQALGSEQCDPESPKIIDILQCIKISYNKADSEPNEQYIKTKSTTEPSETDKIIHTQRLWISYRDKYCKYVFESYFPGLEAPIEELNCMVTLTAARVSELFFIRTVVHLDRFYKQTNNSEAKSTSQAPDSYSKKNRQNYGDEYFMSNCKTAKKLHYENIETCISRLKHQQ